MNNCGLAERGESLSMESEPTRIGFDGAVYDVVRATYRRGSGGGDAYDVASQRARFGCAAALSTRLESIDVYRRICF